MQLIQSVHLLILFALETDEIFAWIIYYILHDILVSSQSAIDNKLYSAWKQVINTKIPFQGRSDIWVFT